MGQPLLVMLSAVLTFAAGCCLAVLTPMAIRLTDRSVVVKAFTGMAMAGGACAMLGAGGNVFASVLGASALSGWLHTVSLIGAGVIGPIVFLLSMATPTIWRRWAPTPQRGQGQPPGSRWCSGATAGCFAAGWNSSRPMGNRLG